MGNVARMVDGNPIDLCIFWATPPPPIPPFGGLFGRHGKGKVKRGDIFGKESKDKTMFGFMLKWGYEFISLAFAILDSNLNTPKLFCAVYVYTYIR